MASPYNNREVRAMTYARLAGMLFLLAATLNAAASPRIQHWQTANGARVLFVEAHELPMVQLRVVFDAGSARDTADRSGLASLTNAMLSQGAGGLDTDQIATRFEDLGAEFGSESLRDMGLVELRSLSESARLGPAAELLGTVLARPDFPADALARERTRFLTALEQERQSPDAVAEKLFYQRLYRDHPYALNPNGTRAGISAITDVDLRAFHSRYYVGSNAVVAIIGDLDVAAARKLADTLVGRLPQGERAPELPAVSALPKPDEQRVTFPSSQSHVLIGEPGMNRGDPDYFALYVGNYVLGGGGLVSRLSDEVREKNGLAYSVYSYFIPMRVAGPFLIGLQTRNAQTGRALELARTTVAGFVQNGPTAEELDAARRNLTGGFPLRIDSNKKIAEYLSVIGFYDLPLTYLDDFIGKVEAVTVEQVRDAFRRRVRPDRMLTVVVGGEG
jgi:zinc protease